MNFTRDTELAWKTVCCTDTNGVQLRSGRFAVLLGGRFRGQGGREGAGGGTPGIGTKAGATWLTCGGGGGGGPGTRDGVGRGVPSPFLAAFMEASSVGLRTSSEGLRRGKRSPPETGMPGGRVVGIGSALRLAVSTRGVAADD